MSNNVPELPDDVDQDDLVELVAKLAGIQTLWALACLFASAGDDEVVVISGRVVKQGEQGPRVYDPMAALAEWHQAAGEKLAFERGEDGLADLAVLRYDLINEETNEVGDELQPLWTNQHEKFSKARLAAELADLLYVTYGTAEIFGINLPAVFELLHSKNMEKLDPETGKPYVVLPNGKVGKPENFVPLTEADIEAVMNSDD